MPLSKLFHKRNSLKNNKAEVLLPAQESTKSEAKERKESPGDCIDAAGQIENIPSEILTDSNLDEAEDIRKEESDESCVHNEQPDSNYRKSSASSEDSQHGSLPEKPSVPKTNRNKTRSVSFKEARSVSFKVGRKKCDSESSVIHSSTDDEGFEDKVLYLKEKDLEKVIGQCVDRIIRESIATAVKSVNIDNLYEEVIKDLSGRSQSESSDCCPPGTIEQKLHTKSVSEYVDLEVDHSFENDPDSEAKDCIASENSTNIMEDKNARTDYDDQLKEEYCSQQQDPNSVVKRNDFSDGYQADIEESESCLSMVSESSCDDLKDLIENTEGESSISKVLKTPIPEEAKSGDFKHPDESPRKDTKSDERVPEKIVTNMTISGDLKVPSVDNTTIGELSVLNETQTGEKRTGSMTDVKDEKQDLGNENIQSESNDFDESNSADECERKDTLKAPEVEDLILMSLDDSNEPQLIAEKESSVDELISGDLGENLPEQQPSLDEKKINWKMGYLQVKLPHKARGKGHLKVWKKRCVAIQPDEFVHDPNNPCLMISVYSAESGAARKHSATFWKSVSGKKAVVYRSNSRTHRYAFTVSDDNKAVVHLAADSETATQEWMAAIRAILWPPSPVMQLEKMLNGSEFEISIIDNDFSYRAGLLGMYGYLTITPKKLILVHPQQGYVIQEWYLNTVDKFQLMHQTRIEDVHKVLAMTTCSDSSTGKGEILIYCTEAVTLLQSLASTIHQLLAYHSTQEGGIYQKELEQIAEWLETSYSSDLQTPAEDYYKVPPRQVKSLLDIPNFIFDKPMTPVASATCRTGEAMDVTKPLLEAQKTESRDSGISAGNAADDFLNCSITSFVVGGGAFPGKSSDSELSDSYTPPHSPAAKAKREESKLAAEM